MKKTQPIGKVLGCLLLVLAFAVTLPVKSHLLSTKAKTETAKKSTSKPEKATSVVIKAGVTESVVSFLPIQLAPADFAFVPFSFPFYLPKLRQGFQKPLFLLSWFENTFCHHIAINAP
jgi:hypothetical protein